MLSSFRDAFDVCCFSVVVVVVVVGVGDGGGRGLWYH